MYCAPKDYFEPHEKVSLENLFTPIRRVSIKNFKKHQVWCLPVISALEKMKQ
jgi:hypothetical protein